MSAPTSKYITGILYPEHFSSYDDMCSMISDLRLAACLSPLHDRDRLQKGGEEKPHYHLILGFPKGKTLNQAKAIFKNVEGVRVELVYDEGAMTRYLTHFGFPDDRKYEYFRDSKDGEPFQDLVKIFGGYPYKQLFYLLSCASDFLKVIMKDIEKFNLISYKRLLIFYISRNKSDVLTWIGKNKYIVQDILNLKQELLISFGERVENYYEEMEAVSDIHSKLGTPQQQLQMHFEKIL